MRAILIVQGGSIGDVLLSLPALRGLRQKFPSARLHLVARRSVGEVLRVSGMVEESSDIESVRLLSLFGAASVIPDELREWAAKLDLGIVWLRGAELVAGKLGEAGVRRVLALPPYPDEIGALHVSDHLLETLRPLDIKPPTRLVKLSSGVKAEAFADGLWEKLELSGEAPVVAIHPGSGSRKKNWPAHRFARVADRVAGELGGKVLIIAGPADDEAVAQMVSSATPGSAAIVRRESLSELTAVLQRCDAYLGNDSGVTHLAGLVGMPTVALFGPTDPRVWAPRGRHVKVLRSQTECAPCLRSVRSNCKELACLEGISTEEVVGAISKALRCRL